MTLDLVKGQDRLEKNTNILNNPQDVTVDQICNKMIDNLDENDCSINIVQELEVKENNAIASDENIIETITREEVFEIEDRRNIDGDILNYEIELEGNLHDEWNGLYHNALDEHITTDSKCKSDENNFSLKSGTSIQSLNMSGTLNLKDSNNNPSLMKFNSEENLMPIIRRSLQNFTTTKTPFLYETCNAKFSNKEKLDKHKKMHFGKIEHTCNICNKSFDSHLQLNMHLPLHTAEKPFLCEFCGKIFPKASSLKLHRRSHTGERPYVCEICDKGFIHKGHLNRHIVIHTSERQFVCKLCKKGFTQNGDLKRHILVHTGERQFVCEFCKKHFKRNGHLKRHIRIHTGERPFVCDICQKGFVHKISLKQHKLTHTGEKLLF